jgi:hypothetical protein
MTVVWWGVFVYLFSFLKRGKLLTGGDTPALTGTVCTVSCSIFSSFTAETTHNFEYGIRLSVAD